MFSQPHFYHIVPEISLPGRLKARDISRDPPGTTDAPEAVFVQSTMKVALADDEIVANEKAQAQADAPLEWRGDLGADRWGTSEMKQGCTQITCTLYMLMSLCATL